MKREIKFKFFVEKVGKVSDWETAKKECDRLSLLKLDGFIPMQFLGFKDKNEREIYEGDKCLFPYMTGSGFENSNPAKIMREKSIDSLLIVFEISEYLSLDFKVYFVKDGKPLVEREWYGYTDEQIDQFEDRDKVDLYKPYYQGDSDLHFIRYLVEKKNLEVIGNIYENPELIEK